MTTNEYAKLLAGRILEEGQGFPSVAVIDEPISSSFRVLGPGREEVRPGETFRPFWYFYDTGPFALTLTADMDDEAGGMRLRGLLVTAKSAGPSPIQTRRGLRLGDSVERVRELYGPPEPWSTTFGSPDWNVTPHHDAEGKVHDLASPDAPFAASLYYPALQTFFVPTEGVVTGIGVVCGERSGPVFLRPKIKAPLHARVDPAVSVAQYVEDKEAPPPAIPGAKAMILAVPPMPEMLTMDYRGLGRITVPVGWENDTPGKWNRPEGGTVSIGFLAGEEKGPTLLDSFVIADRLVGRNAIPPRQRRAPAEFLAHTGADEAYALQLDINRSMTDPARRVFILLARKGEHQYNVMVIWPIAALTVPSPDGVALASAVMRGLRFTSGA